MTDAPSSDDASPQLVWAEDGSPRSGRFGDVYFSRDDGLAETRAVFLDGCGLPDGWRDRSRFTVAELGFGTGLNIVALLDLWRRTGPRDGRLNIFSIEGFPLSRAEAARALDAWPELAQAARPVLDAWPAGTPGFHRLDLPELRATIDLAVGDAAWALEQWSGRADAWFLDGFSPALNPGMWSPEVLALVARRSAPGARLATFTVAGAVRRGLAEHGFLVEKQPGHGRKRERLEARLPGDPPSPPSPRVAVVGAGIAGAAVARALLDGGARVTVIEAARPGAGGSGFPAALVTPRMDAGDALIAGFHAQALERARDLYRRTPDAVIVEGVLQLERAPRDAARFDKVAAQPVWPADAMHRLSPAEVEAHLGEAATAGGLLMRDALALRPSTVVGPWLAPAALLTAEVGALAPGETGWRVLDAEGALLLEADAVVLTAGWGSAALRPDLSLSPVAGQADWVAGATSPPVAWGGYAVPTPDGLLFGATHDRGDTAVQPDDDASARNRAALAAALPYLAARAEGAGGRRKAVRAVTPDRLPLCGEAVHGLFVLAGLGSRGFCVAPLLGEHLAALILQTPSPLGADAARRLHPGRFSA